MPDDEVLIILNELATEETRSFIHANYRVTQTISPLVFIIKRPAAIAPLQKLQGVLIFSTDEEIPSEVLESLDEVETLFVNAWSAQSDLEHKTRPGEGLAWDTAGFEPPDPSPAPDEQDDM